MDLTSMFSHDQIAVAGCFVALGVCGLFMSLSYHFGSAGRKSESKRSILIAEHLEKQAEQDRRKAA